MPRILLHLGIHHHCPIVGRAMLKPTCSSPRAESLNATIQFLSALDTEHLETCPCEELALSSIPSCSLELYTAHLVLQILLKNAILGAQCRSLVLTWPCGFKHFRASINMRILDPIRHRTQEPTRPSLPMLAATVASS